MEEADEAILATFRSLGVLAAVDVSTNGTGRATGVLESGADAGAAPATPADRSHVGDHKGATGEREMGSIAQMNAKLLFRCLCFTVQVLESESQPKDFDLASCQLANAAAERQRQCAYVARQLSARGCNCDFSDILYPVEESSKKLLSWAVASLEQKGPQAQGRIGSTMLGRGSRKQVLVDKEVLSSRVREWLAAFWTPPELRQAPLKACTRLETFPVSVRAGAFCADVSAQFGPYERWGVTIAASLEERRRLVRLKELRASSNLGNKQVRQDQASQLVRERMKEALRRANQKASNDSDNAKTSLAQVALLVQRQRRSPLRRVSETQFTRRSTFGVEPVLRARALWKETQPPSQCTDTADTAAAMQDRDEIIAMEQKLAECRAATELSQQTIEDSLARKIAGEHALEAAVAEQKRLSRVHKVHTQALQITSSGPEGLAELDAALAEADNRRAALQREWDAVRTPLERELRDLEQGRDEGRRNLQKKVATVARLKAEMHDMEASIGDQQDLIARLESQKAKLPENISRELYTSRIFDLINQVKRQRADIARVIEDVRQLQIEMNKVSEKLRRTEIVTDELVFKISDTMREDPASLQAYRYLHDMRALFGELVEKVAETAKAQNKARELKARSDNLRGRINLENFAKIKQDLDEIKLENNRRLNSSTLS